MADPYPDYPSYGYAKTGLAPTVLPSEKHKMTPEELLATAPSYLQRGSRWFPSEQRSVPLARAEPQFSNVVQWQQPRPAKPKHTPTVKDLTPDQVESGLAETAHQMGAQGLSIAEMQAQFRKHGYDPEQYMDHYHQGYASVMDEGQMEEPLPDYETGY